MFPRLLPVIGAYGVKGKISGKGALRVRRDRPSVGLEVLPQPVHIPLGQVGIHHPQVLAQVVAGRFHCLHVLQQPVVLHPLKVQQLLLHGGLLLQGGLTADAVQ